MRVFFALCVSLKVEYDKLANEKTEMQRHYVMVRSRSSRATIMASKLHGLVEDQAAGGGLTCVVVTGGWG